MGTLGIHDVGGEGDYEQTVTEPLSIFFSFDHIPLPPPLAQDEEEVLLLGRVHEPEGSEGECLAGRSSTCLGPVAQSSRSNLALLWSIVV